MKLSLVARVLLNGYPAMVTAVAITALGACGPEPRSEREFEETATARHIPGSQLAKCGIVLETGARDDWDGAVVESPVVWFDSLRGRWGMVYAGYDVAPPEQRGDGSVGTSRIGLAWSDDLLQWEKDPANPIFEASGGFRTPDAAGVTGPFVRHENRTYFLFYIGTTEAGYERGRKTINLATSTDLKNWTRFAGNPIIEPAGDGWRRDAIWHPHVVKVDDIYYLFFNASGVVGDLEEETIGYATSTDLFNWSVHDEHSPVLVGSRLPGAWDARGRTGDPSLYRVGDTWYMAYYSWNGVKAEDGLAMTSVEQFPLGWEPYEGNPVIRVGEPGSFDAKYAHKPFIVRTDSVHYHFYTAVDTADSREIAGATWPDRCGP